MAVRIWKGNDPEADKGPEHFDVSHEGHVLSLTEHNGYDDSDFFALVWDDEKGEPREVWYATTRGWTYNNMAIVDATPEVLVRYDAWRAARAARYAADLAAIEAAVPRKGRHVRVVKGRKVPVGTEGEVIWYGEGRYGTRVGLKDAQEKVHWTAADNVEVTAA